MKSVILAGGSGTRLFPLSRKNFPKQFLNIGNSEKSLFQNTFERSLKLSDLKDIYIITGDSYKFLIKSQLDDLNIPDFKNIIVEPVGRNTASAIALTVKYLLDKENVNKDEILCVMPSDHIINPIERFVSYIKKAEEAAKKGYIVTFGIKPSKPETGYGYIEVSQEKISDGVYKVKTFHEKPDLKKAQEYLLRGNFLWNSGIFIFSIDTILREFKNYLPDVYSLLENATYEEFIMSFSELPDISIDYAIIEKSSHVSVVPADIIWSDVGSWDSVYELLDKDENKNVKIGNVIDIDTKESMIIGNKRVISTVGLENLIIIDTDDVLLISRRGESQKVREVVEKIKSEETLKEKAVYHTTVYRPWGSYTELEEGERYRIKRITVKPGGMLSLQMHYHRSEHWVVIKGTARVILEKDGKLEEFYVHENESIYVPKTTKHRLINPGKVPLEIIEVQVGEYVGEDDIVRFEDVYNRK